MKHKEKHKIDYLLVGIVCVLLITGILFLASVSASFSQEKFGRTTYYLFHQIIRLSLGLILGFIAFKISLSFLRKYALIFILINLTFMALVFIPKIGIITGGAPRWMNFSLFTFQPSEFLKLTFIIYLSSLLASFIKNKKTFTLIPFLIILGVLALLLTLQLDVSTLAVIISVGILMYFSSGFPFWHTILVVLISAGGILGLIRIAPYRMKRILVFLNPGLDPMGIGYQIKQILIAVGSGGIFGLGLGMSVQKFGWIPQTMSDSIFAIFAEEFGFVGSVTLIFLFLLLLWTGLKIAKGSNNKFSQLLAIGISCWICIQAFINIGAMVSILPLTGIPLPFISYGGSHIIAELIGIGILLNISKSSKK
jgi:cell division protein FtsW